MADDETQEAFCVDQIDHVELHVPNRQEAAGWYRTVLGLDVISEFSFWADDPRGPLMIGTRHGHTKLALFEGEPTGSQRTIGFHLVAFRVSASSFVRFVARLAELNLCDERNRKVTADRVADHQMALSIYFCDPWGHQLEVTTYDYQEAKRGLRK